MELPWEFSDPVEPLYVRLTAEAGEADRAAAALRHLAAWVAANNVEILSPTTSSQIPARGWAGTFHGTETVQGWRSIAMFQHRLGDILALGDFNAASIIR